MLDINSFFSGIDNLYKFLTIGGIIMVFTSLVYPLEKEQLIKIEIITNEQEQALLNNEITNTLKAARKLHLKSTSYKTKIDSLKKLDQSKHLFEIKKTQETFNLSHLKLKEKQTEIETKQIIINYHNKRIIQLRKNAQNYSQYTTLLKCIGIASFILGLFFWVKSTYTSEKLKKEELKKLKRT